MYLTSDLMLRCRPVGTFHLSIMIQVKPCTEWERWVVKDRRSTGRCGTGYDWMLLLPLQRFMSETLHINYICLSVLGRSTAAPHPGPSGWGWHPFDPLWIKDKTPPGAFIIPLRMFITPVLFYRPRRYAVKTLWSFFPRLFDVLSFCF